AALSSAREALADAEAGLAAARREEDYLRHVVGELQALAPEPGEEETLAAERQRLMQAEKIVTALQEAEAALSGPEGVEARLRQAQRSLERVAPLAGGALDEVLAALDRAASELLEGVAQLGHAGIDMDLDPRRLDGVEERLFALRDLARKHRIQPGELPRL